MVAATRWTHESVLRFAGDTDPVAAITERTRTVVAEAMDAGWSGPPFNPIGVADFLRLEIIPSSDVQDARTVPVGRSDSRIEYNPNRPPGRMRYSLAHEIAHTFFPDCAKRIRNRETHMDLSGDDWQLEALCNIAAAELLMPLGSLPLLRDSDLNVDHLMQLRGEYQVSSEAMFIRAVSVTDTPSAMFCAHRIETGRGEGSYRLDYVIPSHVWTPPIPRRGILPLDSVVSECTAIGYTAKRDEPLGGPVPVHIECVGVPPYPGSAHPRVVGILLPLDATSSREPSIVYLKGSVLEPRGNGPCVVAHVVNSRTLNWGGRGVAVALRRKWPRAQEDFRLWGRDRKISQALGEVCFSEVDRNITVASMVAQVGYGDSKKPRIRYAALRRTLAEVASVAAHKGASLHIPRIGCGQAGGSWEIVRDLIISSVTAANVRVIVYDPPDTTLPVAAQPSLSFTGE